MAFSVDLGDLRAQLTQGGKMQVDGPRAELAAAPLRYFMGP